MILYISSSFISGKRVQEYICVIIASCLLAFNAYHAIVNFRAENLKWHVATVCKYNRHNVVIIRRWDLNSNIQFIKACLLVRFEVK